MTALIPFHAGLVVTDLERAAEHLGDAFGYTFHPPTRLKVHELEDRISGVTGPLEMRAAYSKEGPFRLELIECQGEGVFAPSRGGLHHLGVWEPDPEGRLRRLEEAGEPVDAVMRKPDGSISVIYGGPTGASGVRVEYVSQAQRPRLERWFETGVLA